MGQRLRTGTGVVLLALGFVVAVLDRAPHANAVTRTSAIAAAAAYGPAHGYHVGIAVYDTWTNRVYGGGHSTGTFASESVVKVMIANRLLVQGRMHGTTAKRAYRMITRSDDAIASAFYGSVGGDGLIGWIKHRYHVWNLGSRPSRPNWWGNTHITPRGLVRYYVRMKRDPRVGPWILNAMHHAKPYGSDGTWQFFGLPQATTGAAIKQGWGCDYDDFCTRFADFNTTGFVNGNRYAVAILARGPIRDYGKAISGMLSRTAKLLLPGGHFPDPVPVVTSLSMSSGRTAGGQRVAVHGNNFTDVSAVLFGNKNGTRITVLGPHWLRVITPGHMAGRVAIRVVTSHGVSPVGAARFTFVAPPSVTAVRPRAGRAMGGDTVTISGARLGTATRVWFGGQAGGGLHVLSTTSLKVVTPPHTSGTVNVRVVSRYGTSAVGAADRFTYVAAPTVTAVNPTQGPSAGGTPVTITGTDLSLANAVWFGKIRATDLTVSSPTSITVTAPAHADGKVDVTVRTPGGTSAANPGDQYTYTG